MSAALPGRELAGTFKVLISQKEPKWRVLRVLHTSQDTAVPSTAQLQRADRRDSQSWLPGSSPEAGGQELRGGAGGGEGRGSSENVGLAQPETTKVEITGYTRQLSLKPTRFSLASKSLRVGQGLLGHSL